MKTCIFCGNEFDENTTPLEHIIPEAMGNKELTCHNVCQDCNRKLSPIEDKLIRSFRIKAARQYHKIKGKRGKIPDVDFGETIIEGQQGAKARYTVKKDGTTELKVKGKSDNGTIHLDFEEFTVDKVKEVKRRREGKKNHRQPYTIWVYGDNKKIEEATKKIEATINESEQQAIKGTGVKKGEVKPPSMLNTEIIEDLRMYCALAKIAYEYYQKHFPDYSSSADAKVFRDYIFEEDIDKRESLPMAYEPAPESDASFARDKHFLTAQSGMVLVILFGYPHVLFDMHPLEEDIPDYGAIGKGVFTTISVKDGLEQTEIFEVPENPKGRKVLGNG